VNLRERLLLLAASACFLAGCEMAARSDVGLPLDFSAVANEIPSEAIWGQWRGGDHHGVLLGASPPTKFDIETPLWSTATLGAGNSSPIVFRDRIFLTAIIDRQGAVLCFDSVTGTQLWQRSVGEMNGASHNRNGWASATPATDGQRVYSTFAGDLVVCHDLEGKEIWRHECQGIEHSWGFASSPVLHEGVVIQLCDSEDQSYLLALNKRTGTVVWQVSRESDGNWSTPVIVWANSEKAGLRRELIVNGTGRRDGHAGIVTAYDVNAGEVLWYAEGTTGTPCPTPAVGDGYVISASGGNGPVLALQTGGSGDVSQSKSLWSEPRGGPYVPSGVVVASRYYAVSDTGLLTCSSVADGQLIWKHRLGGTVSASLVATSTHIYATTEEGDIYVVRHADQFELVAKNELGEAVDATPALASECIFVRTVSRLICFSRSAAKQLANAAD
jgi:outer membrane protein assembly factor BamB